MNLFHGPVIEAILPIPANVKPKLVNSRHPDYNCNIANWYKWRLTYQSGIHFVNTYLERFSIREDSTDFDLRKKITPVPAFAKAAINDIKNSIFQRMSDTTREGGPENYQAAIQGKNGGVNKRGGSMDWYIGDQILPELLTMKKVGTYIDAPPLAANESVKSRLTKHPYFYRYCAEDILNWAWKDDGSRMEFSAVLLRDYKDEIDPVSKLSTGCSERYRLLTLKDDGVHVKFLDKDDKIIGTEVVLNLTKIPFVVFEISESLLTDAAGYQIALLNLLSSDILFALKSNYPFYTEQRNPAAEDLFRKNPINDPIPRNQDNTIVQVTQIYDPTCSNPRTGPEIQVGTIDGRTYPTGVERPGFIAPPTDSLQASMKLQANLKEEIRLLVNLALSNIKPQMASAESKAMDQAGLESGLSYIGLELEFGERQIAEIWALYENKPAATVKYPERYSLKTDAEQRAEAKDLKTQLFTSSSTGFQKEIIKRIATILLGNKISAERLSIILKEIDTNQVITADPDILNVHLFNGLVSNATASEASGYAAGETALAAKDHLNRIMAIAQSQTPAAGTSPAVRGAPDLSVDPNAPVADKQGKPQRGPSANVSNSVAN